VALTDLPGEVPERTDPRSSSSGAPRGDRRPTGSVDPRNEDLTDPGRVRPAVTASRAAVVPSNPVSTVRVPDVERRNGLPTNGVPGTGPTAAVRVVDAPLDDEATQAVPMVSRVKAPVTSEPKRSPTSGVTQSPGALRGSAAPDLVVRPVGPAEEARSRQVVVAPKPKRSISLRRPRPRVRRVRRVVRSIDTWTVFKVSILFYIVAYAVLLVAGVLLWNLAYTTGTIENIQEFFKDFGWDNYQFFGDRIFHASWIIGMFLVVAGTGLNVTLALLFNLISDLVGGIGVTVLEEEVRIVPIESGPTAPKG
jgi:hypothetical protein